MRTREYCFEYFISTALQKIINIQLTECRNKNKNIKFRLIQVINT